MRRILFLRLFMALGLVFFVQSFCLKNAHAQVTIILNTPSQLPERVNDWERLNALFSVTITNTGSAPLQRLRVAATVTNLDNNAVLFRTKNDLTRPFNAPPRTPQTLTAPQILPANSFEYDASVQTALIRTNTLPEGAYRLCVRVIDERGTTIGFEQCRTFNVVIPDPPSLISPVNGDSLRRAAMSLPHLPMFQWTPVFARFGQQSKYKVRIVPVFEGQQPRQALEGNPVLLEKIVQTSSYQWLPSDPQFGNYPNAKGFVWQVQAVDPNDVSIANVRAVGRNEGKSEMFTFGIPQGTSNNSGALGNKNNPKPGNKGLSPGKLDAIIPKTTTVSGNVRYFFSEDGWQNNAALANTPVLLVEYYSFENAKGNYEASMAEIQSALMKKGFESFKVLASGVTNADGKFTLSFVQTDSTGIMIQKGYSLNAKQDLKAVDFSGGLVGNLRRVLRLIVANEYMLSPDDNIIVQPGEVKNFSKPFLSQVRSWQLAVRLLNKGTKDVPAGNMVKDELSVFVVRNALPSGIPKNEGDKKGSTIVVQKNLQNEGLAVIDRLVKNISLNDRYHIMASMGKGAVENLTFDIVQFDPTKDQKGEYAGTAKEDDAVFNSEYKYPTRKLDLWGTPQKPRIYGTVLHAETGELLEGVNVLAENIAKTNYTCGGFYTPFSSKTNTQGEFSLNNLKEDCPWKITVSKPGYIQQQFWVNNGEVLNKGEQANAGGGTLGIRLTPQLQVFGRVVDSKGNGVDAIVQIGNSKAKQTDTSKAEDKGKFMCRVVPSDKPQTVIATPVEADNYERTFEIVIDGKEDALNNPLLSPIILQSRMFRLRVSVRTEEGSQTFKAKAGMTVRAVSGENILASAVSDKTGIAMLEWKNMVEEGTFRIVVAPTQNENWSYTPVTVELSQQMPEGVTLTLTPGAQVSGSVVLKLGSGEEPVKNARVSLAASGANLPTTYTDEKGAFTLRNLPKAKTITLQASFGSAPSKTMAEIASEGLEKLEDKTKNVSLAKNKDDKPTESYVGAETVVSTGNGNVSGVKMTLTSYNNNMDLSKLLGFDIVLSDVSEKDGKTFISGSLDMKQLATKSGFAEPEETAVLSFDNIEIKPGSTKNTKGVPIADVVTNEIPLEQNSIELSSKGKLKAIALTFETPTLKKDASGIGVIAGKVHINLSASPKLTDGKLSLQDDNALYLAHPKPQQGQSASVIPVFYGVKDGAKQSLAVAPNGFAITDKNGQTLKYSLYDFQAENTPMQSFARLDKDSLFLYTTITLSIANLEQENVSVSFGVPITANANGIEEIKGSSPLTLQMQNWELVATSWSLTKSGFTLDKGSLKTGIVDAPFTDIRVLPEGGKSKLFIPNGAFTLNEMTLGGIIPISFMKSPTLTYNDKQPWRFEAISSSMSSPAATITKPTGFNEDIKLGAITLFSNDKDKKVEIGVLEQSLTLYNQFDFKPSSILIGNGVTFKGHLDLRVPDFAAVNANVNVAKWGDAPTLDNFNVTFKTTHTPMTIELDPKSMTIGTKGFFASGEAFENGVRRFPIQFARTEKVIEARLPKGYEFFLDETSDNKNAPAPKLTNVEGAMIVPTASKNGKWETMRFGGDLTNAGGASGKLYFAMNNALKADDLIPSKIGVENMPSDFGGITLVYNPNKHRLEGGVHVENSAAGGKVKGDIQIIVDAGGWYFAGSGSLEMTSPNVSGYALLVFGNHAINTELSGLMAQYSSYLKTYGRPPLGMPTQNVKGFYFEGGFAMPIPNIPELGFKFGLVAAELKHQIGGSVRLGMDFSNFKQKKELSMGLSLMAGLYLGLDATMGFACAEVDASVNADISFDGMFTDTSNWSVEAAAQATLAGMTKFGAGGCPSCDFFGCFVETMSASVTLGAKGYYKSGGQSDMSFYLK